MSEEQEKYRELCSSGTLIPVYNQDWWLDITCGGAERWDVVLVERDRQIVAALPYYKVKKYMFNLIQMPQMTLSMGIWIKYPDKQKYATKLAYEREIYLELIEKLPRMDYSHQQFNWHITNWSTFYWRGFRQTTRYTYVIENIADPDAVFENFLPQTQLEVQEAEQICSIIETADVDRFLEMHAKNFDPKIFPMPYSAETLRALDRELAARGRRKIWLALDREGRVLSGVYIVWDEGCAYNLLGGSDPELEGASSHSLLIWHALKEMSVRTSQFDFYGGMHETIERFFRSFGAIQKPYFQLSKFSGRLFKFAYYLKHAIR
ncbi:GNAT family N-acetyltransferase [Cohnella soli]|uniref:GNAT family N-acetyltransferase n=1 Tax=Cohnella soli TaxID=425005 RepID=A0ABW0HXV5_9BACL